MIKRGERIGYDRIRKETRGNHVEEYEKDKIHCFVTSNILYILLVVI
jgi:hypothetical protein